MRGANLVKFDLKKKIQMKYKECAEYANELYRKELRNGDCQEEELGDGADCGSRDTLVAPAGIPTVLESWLWKGWKELSHP